MVTPSTPELILLTSVINGDKASQKQLYDLIAPAMYTLCLTNTRSTEDAETTFTNGFINLIKALPSYIVNTSFTSWCSAIFIQAINEHYSIPGSHVNEHEQANEDVFA
jgi:DNA-directed RNA polymerase specialized sigma24 family protein